MRTHISRNSGKLSSLAIHDVTIVRGHVIAERPTAFRAVLFFNTGINQRTFAWRASPFRAPKDAVSNRGTPRDPALAARQGPEVNRTPFAPSMGTPPLAPIKDTRDNNLDGLQREPSAVHFVQERLPNALIFFPRDVKSGLGHRGGGAGGGDARRHRDIYRNLIQAGHGQKIASS